LRDTATTRRAAIELRAERAREREKGEKCTTTNEMEKENRVEEEEEEEEEAGSRSLLRSNMLSPHEVLSLPLRVRSPSGPHEILFTFDQVRPSATS